jgi:hypothetical protein
MGTLAGECAVLTSVARGTMAMNAFEKVLRTRGKVVWAMTYVRSMLLAQLKVPIEVCKVLWILLTEELCCGYSIPRKS